MVNYAYLIGSSIALLIWSILFIYRKDVRKEMLFISILTAFAGLIAEGIIYTKDWWRPATITGTRVGIEDFIFGFAVGGIASVIYEEIFVQRHRKIPENMRNHSTFILPIVFFFTFVMAFWILDFHSFASNIIAYITAIAIIFVLRRDLILYSFLSGSLMVLVSLPLFWIPLIFYPTAVQEFWLLHELSGKLILGIPVEDLNWFFLTGMFIGPLYEFWYGYRTIKIKSN